MRKDGAEAHCRIRSVGETITVTRKESQDPRSLHSAMRYQSMPPLQFASWTATNGRMAYWQDCDHTCRLRMKKELVLASIFVLSAKYSELMVLSANDDAKMLGGLIGVGATMPRCIAPQPRGQTKIPIGAIDKRGQNYLVPALHPPPQHLKKPQAKWRRFRSDLKQEAAATWHPSLRTRTTTAAPPSATRRASRRAMRPRARSRS
jgi:hypothetical protein